MQLAEDRSGATLVWTLVTLAYNLRRLHDSGRWRAALVIG